MPICYHTFRTATGRERYHEGRNSPITPPPLLRPLPRQLDQPNHSRSLPRGNRQRSLQQNGIPHTGIEFAIVARFSAYWPAITFGKRQRSPLRLVFFTPPGHSGLPASLKHIFLWIQPILHICSKRPIQAESRPRRDGE